MNHGRAEAGPYADWLVGRWGHMMFDRTVGTSLQRVRMYLFLHVHQLGSPPVKGTRTILLAGGATI